MALDDYLGEVVLTGTWLYDGKVPKPICVIARNFDAFWKSPDFEELDRDPIPLGPEGRLYTVAFPPARDWDAWPYQTVDELKAWADTQAWGPVTWDEPL